MPQERGEWLHRIPLIVITPPGERWLAYLIDAFLWVAVILCLVRSALHHAQRLQCHLGSELDGQRSTFDRSLSCSGPSVGAIRYSLVFFLCLFLLLTCFFYV
ncbi:hypothetical protein BJ912DRAFT_948660, partial [Pholiota molesta]